MDAREALREPLLHDTELKDEARACLNLLYDHLDFADLLNHPYTYFKGLVETSLAVQRQVPWGRASDDPHFLRYVLDPRSGQETLDDARVALADVLLPLVKGMDVDEAVRQVNMWCFGQAVYGSTDRRTAGPLTLMRRGFGRCGEESSFVVAALRAVGIPCRQVYAPLWVHGDDNHAWVEVWTGERWHYIGACEPEPVHDKGWFSVPATRAALVVARVLPGVSVPGERAFVGAEHRPLVPVTARYAPVRALTVVTEPEAWVTVRVLNYGEFAPLVMLQATDGTASLELGMTTYRVSAVRDGRYGEVDVTVGDQGAEVHVELVDGPDTGQTEGFWRVPQPLKVHWADVDDATAQAHEAAIKAAEAARIARHAPDPLLTDARLEGAKDMGDVAPEDGEGRTAGQMIAAAFGNRAVIETFMGVDVRAGEAVDPARLELLRSINYKDYSDVTLEVLEHHLAHAPARPDGMPEAIYRDTLLSPRLSWEGLTCWRTIDTLVPEAEWSAFREVPGHIDAWVDTVMHHTDAEDNSRQYGDPYKALEQGAGNRLTRQNVAVAIARCLGIPARISAVTGAPEYFDGTSWSGGHIEDPTGVWVVEPEDFGTSMPYGSSWTVSHWTGTNWQVLRLGGMVLDKDGAPTQLMLAAGRYRLTVTARADTGDVAWASYTVDLVADQTVHTTVVNPALRLPSTERQVYPDPKVEGDVPAGTPRVMMFLDPGPEPTEHLLNELMARRYALDSVQSAWGIVLPEGADTSQVTYQRLRMTFPKMPVARVSASELARLDAVVRPANLPYVFVVDQDNQIALQLEGYAIGSADRALGTFERESV